MGAGDLLGAVRLKLEEFFWKARSGFAAFIARKKAMAYLLSGLALVLVVVVIAVILNKAGEAVPEVPGLFSGQRIPMEEFFIPGEPDFLPPVILYREQKDRWTAEDAVPFWTDPATIDDNWRNKVEEYVEKLLESVP